MESRRVFFVAQLNCIVVVTYPNVEGEMLYIETLFPKM